MNVMPRLKRSRVLRSAAVLALVPVVVFSNPQTASAAVGPWAQVSVTVPLPVIGEGYGGNGKCAFNVQHADTSVNIGTGGYCTGLPDVSPGSTQPLEAGSSIGIVASGQFRTGGDCSGDTTVTLGPHDKNGTIRVAGSIPATSFNIGGTALGADCDIARICITVGNGGAPACQNVNLPSPEEQEEPATACPYGTPRLTNPQVVLHSEGSSSYRWIIEYDVTFAGEAPPGRRWTATSYNSRTGVWRSYPQTIDRFAGTNKLRIGENLQYAKAEPKPDLGAFGSQGFQFSTPMILDASGAEVPSGTAGATSWNNMANGTSADNFASGFAAPSSQGSSFAIPPLHNHYYGGWTDPSKCRFWLGPKVLNVDGHDGDEPSSLPGEPLEEPEPPVEPVVEPPPPIEPPEGFNWLEAIWAVLVSILNALGSLVQAIVDGIVGALESLVEAVLDGLVDLFVPGEGFFEDKADQASEAFEGTTLDNYLAVVEGMVPSGSSGCEGPSFTMGPFGSAGGDSRPLSACAGPAATAATATRLAITVGLGISTVFACIRILGRSLGWDPGLGGGGAS